MHPALLLDTFWTPKQLPGLKLWLDASKLTGFADGDAVGTWSDLSGQQNHVTQGTAANRPLYKVAGVNGRPGVLFDGVNDELLAAASVVSGVAPLTAFAVVKSDGAAIGRFIGHPGPADGFSWGKSNAADKARFTTRGVKDYTSTGANVGATARVVSVLFETSSFQVTHYLDGVASGPFTHTNNANAATGVLYVGSQGGTEFLTGHISAVCVYGRALTDVERIRVQKYLAAPYGIAVT